MGDEVSDWVTVSSGIPQGWVLGPTLFSIFINDLSEVFKSTCKIFADDTKLIASIRLSHLLEDCTKLKEDIDKISEWCKDWFVCLNSEKCKVNSIGKENQGTSYSIYNQSGTRSQLIEVASERDLGIIISRNLKPHNQVFKAASTANRMLTVLRNTFESRDPLLWKRLYITCLSTHLEYAVASWSPYIKKDYQILENFLRMAI